MVKIIISDKNLLFTLNPKKAWVAFSNSFLVTVLLFLSLPIFEKEINLRSFNFILPNRCKVVIDDSWQEVFFPVVCFICLSYETIRQNSSPNFNINNWVYTFCTTIALSSSTCSALLKPEFWFDSSHASSWWKLSLSLIGQIIIYEVLESISLLLPLDRTLCSICIIRLMETRIEI